MTNYEKWKAEQPANEANETGFRKIDHAAATLDL